MEVSAQSAPRASRPFVTTPHDASPEAGLFSVVPERGPCWDGAIPCRIRRHHRRRRKTGPPWGWVDVASCAVHRVAFTIYPPGHVPYGRVALVDLAPDGSEHRSDVTRAGTAAEAEAEATAVLFAAANDARDGRRWPRDDAPDPPGAVRSSQRRRVARAATLFGLVTGKPPEASTSAAVTELPEGRLVEFAAKLSTSRSLVEWGKTVARVLGDLVKRAGRALMDRLAVLGHVAGFWGRPYRWRSLARPGPGQLIELGRAFSRGAVAGAGARDPATLAKKKAREPTPTHENGPRDLP